MKRMMKKWLFMLCCGTALTAPVYAQTDSKAVIQTYSFTDQSLLRNMSNNGKWAAACSVHPENEAMLANPKLIDLTTKTVKELLTDEQKKSVAGCGALDVTDDGKIVVGDYNNMPAVWMDGEWANLPMPKGGVTGDVNAITPDGKYAVGVVRYASDYEEVPVLWDLTLDGEIVATPGILEKDMTGEDQKQNRFIAISPDGKNILGCMSFSYIQPAAICYYVYNRDTQKSTPIGFNVDSNYKWTPLAKDLYFIDAAVMSANGKFISGQAYMVADGDTEFTDEYYASFVYSVETGTFTLYGAKEEVNYGGFAVDGNGGVYSASPVGSPAREAYVYSGKYWCSFTEVLSQVYGIDYTKETGFENTGTPTGANDDGTVIMVAASNASDNYILNLPEPMQQAAKSVRLLNSWTATPTSGSTFSKLTSINVSFTRDIKVLGDKKCAELLDEDGNIVRNSLEVSVSASSTKAITVAFRSTLLEEGKKYVIRIPAGTVCMAGDDEQTNNEIRIAYIGRKDEPVSMMSVYPAQNDEVKSINYSTNPVVMYFDTYLKLSGNGAAYLYKDGEDTPLCEMNMAIGTSGSLLVLYPSTNQYLYKGADYHITFSKGAVTDVMGNNPNDSITLYYKGSYVREASYSDGILFDAQFNTKLLNNFMLYDADHLTPNAEMKEWSFDNNTPWSIAMDDESTVINAVSHSNYTPAGRSDDWMATTQLEIPSANCYLEWTSQSYREEAFDTLRVFVLEKNEVINTLSSADIDEFKEKGTCIYEGRELPGAEENVLAGDWVSHRISLKQYEGKNIYIAFVNQNENQSAIFIGSVKVVLDEPFRAGLITDNVVVGKNEVAVKGTVNILSADRTYNQLTAVLKDAQGNEVDKVTYDNLELKKGDNFSFEFAKPLPLETGRVNKYFVELTAGDDKVTLNDEVKNLAFNAKKNILIEEATGMWCGNCPQGIVAMEKMESLFKDQIVPVCIHNGDAYAFSTYEKALGFSAYPSAYINRGRRTYSPMGYMTNGTDKDFTFSIGDGSCWLDAINEELQTPAEAEVSLTAVYDEDLNKIVAKTTVRNAVEGLKTNLLYIVTEDELIGYQTNYFSEIDDADMGDWGKNGLYGSATVYGCKFYDVARSIVGTTINGTPGYFANNLVPGEENTVNVDFALPSNISNPANCKVVCVMLDSENGTYINSCRSKLFSATGIQTVNNDNTTSVYAENGSVVVKASQADVAIYTLDGTLLNTQVVNGEATIGVMGHQGMVIVKATTNGKTTVKKVMVQ